MLYQFPARVCSNLVSYSALQMYHPIKNTCICAWIDILWSVDCNANELFCSEEGRQNTVSIFNLGVP